MPRRSHPGQLVLAVGDSVTDDLQSWAEILRHLLDLRRPGDGVQVANGGLSAHTTAMVLRRWPATLATTPWPRQPARRPDQPTRPTHHSRQGDRHEGSDR